MGVVVAALLPLLLLLLPLLLVVVVAAAAHVVFVGNLSWGVAWPDLKDVFNKVGEVVRADVWTKPDGRSKGCGMVEFSTAEGATRAISELHDVELDGRLMLVRADRES